MIQVTHSSSNNEEKKVSLVLRLSKDENFMLILDYLIKEKDIRLIGMKYFFSKSTIG